MDDDGHESETRTAYDLVAGDYEELLRDALADSLWDRAVLGAFAELVIGSGGGAVADLGCGPGRITGHLSDLGLEVVGVDLSPEMVTVARAAHPHLTFIEGSMLDLDLDDGELAGAVAWYSVIHTPPSERPALYAELARVLRPGGHVVVAFQVGDERVRLDHAYGHDLSLEVYRLSPDDVSEQLTVAGFAVTSRLVREPALPEKQPQAYLVAQRVSGDGVCLAHSVAG